MTLQIFPVYLLERENLTIGPLNTVFNKHDLLKHFNSGKKHLWFFSTLTLMKQTDSMMDFQYFIEKKASAQAMLPAFEAILGHRSAHSLATGPVMAEPLKQTQQTDSGVILHSKIKLKHQHSGCAFFLFLFHHGLRLYSTT